MNLTLGGDQWIVSLAKTTVHQPGSSVPLIGLLTWRSWTAQLAEEIAEADAFILLVGEAGVGNWQVPEYLEAHDRWVKSGRTFPLIVILIEGQKAPGLPFLHQLQWIETPDPTSERNVAHIFNAVSGRGVSTSELWRYSSPYRGLEAMEEKDSEYFFGRTTETVEVLEALAAQDRLLVLIGNSGVGKSSIARAGVLAALKRQAWPEHMGTSKIWPAVFHNSRRWCFLSLRPGDDPLKALVECFLDTWQYAAADYERVNQQRGWMEQLQDKATLSDLIGATERRLEELRQPKPPAFFLYVDQGEELYVRDEDRRRRRFSELLAQALADPRLRVMMSIRSDFLGSLHKDTPLFKVRHQIDVPPLGEAELHEVVSRPAQLLGARFETERLVDIITRRTAEESRKDVGALPLLSYTLDDMWKQMVRRGDGTLRLPAQAFDLAAVLVERADTFLATRPSVEPTLQRVMTLRCATVREDGEPTRRRAPRSEFSADEWQLVSELANSPYRLLITATTNARETYAEVAHESIFLHWQKLRDWIVAEKSFLSWRKDFEMLRKKWEDAPSDSKDDALLMGIHLADARQWIKERASDLSARDLQFVQLSVDGAQTRPRREKKEARRISAKRRRDEEEALKKELVETIRGWVVDVKRAIRWPP